MALKKGLKNRFFLALVIAIALILFLLPRWFENRSYQFTKEQTSPVLRDSKIDGEDSNSSGASPHKNPPSSQPGAQQNTSPMDQAIARLQNESSATWRPIFDSRSGRLRTLELGRLEVPVNDGSAGLVDIAQKFLAAHSIGLFGVNAKGLRFDKLVESERSKVVFEQYIDGRRVLGATLALVFENSALVRVQSDLVTDAVGRPTGTVIPLEQALSWIEIHGTDKFAAQGVSGNQVVKAIAEIKPELVYLPHDQQLIVAYAIYADRFNEEFTRIDRVRILVDALSPHIIKTSRMVFN
jgi:hypothetical protein